MQFFKFTRVGRTVTRLKTRRRPLKVVEAGMSSAGIVIRRARVGNSGAPLSPSDRGPLDKAIRASEAAPAAISVPQQSRPGHPAVGTALPPDATAAGFRGGHAAHGRLAPGDRVALPGPEPLACAPAVCRGGSGSPARNGATSAILLAQRGWPRRPSPRRVSVSTGRFRGGAQSEAGALAELGQAAARPAETVAFAASKTARATS